LKQAQAHGQFKVEEKSVLTTQFGNSEAAVINSEAAMTELPYFTISA
jgi:hypothetical protein